MTNNKVAFKSKLLFIFNGLFKQKAKDEGSNLLKSF